MDEGCEQPQSEQDRNVGGVENDACVHHFAAHVKRSRVDEVDHRSTAEQHVGRVAAPSPHHQREAGAEAAAVRADLPEEQQQTGERHQPHEEDELGRDATSSRECEPVVPLHDQHQRTERHRGVLQGLERPRLGRPVQQERRRCDERREPEHIMSQERPEAVDDCGSHGIV